MKTRFSRRPKFLSPGRSLAVGITLTTVFLVFLLRAFFPDAFLFIAQPLFSFGNAASSLATLPGDAKRREDEIERLKKENAALAEENASLAARLKDLHAVGTEHGIVAGVLAGPPQSPYDALIIGAGSADGVVVGMRVHAGGVPVGTVESVSGGSARVALYSAPGTETAGWAGDARTSITIHGDGGGMFSADAPKDAGLVEGDLVYLPGPGALPVGTIARIDTDPSSPRATLRIRPAANPFSMTEVEVLPSPAP